MKGGAGLVLVFLFVGVVGGVQGGRTNVMECMENYVINVEEEICNRLQAFDVCVANVADDDANLPRALNALNAAKILYPDCVIQEVEQGIDVDDEGVEFVARRDIRFRRATGDTVSSWELASRVAALKYKASLLAKSSELERIQSRLSDAISRVDLQHTIVSAIKDTISNSSDVDSAIIDLHTSINQAAAALHHESITQDDMANVFDIAVNSDVQDVAATLAKRTYEVNTETDITRMKYDAIVDDKFDVVADNVAEGETDVNEVIAWAEAFVTGSESRLDAIEGLVGNLQDQRTAIGQQLIALSSFDSNTAQKLPMPSFKSYIHSGYCNRHGRGGGWNNYCFTNTEFNNADTYFQIVNRESGIFQALRNGYIRVSYWGIANVCNYAHIQLVVNGQYRHYGHENAQNSWTDNFMDLTWKMNANDQFYVTVYNSGCSSYAYHSGNANGAHSRLQVLWEGE